MRVLAVANSFWYLSNFRWPLLQSLLAEGHQVSLLAGADPYMRGLSDEMPVHRWISLSRRGVNPLRELLTFAQLASIVREVRPELLLLFTIKAGVYGSIAARMMGVRAVCTVTGLGWGLIGRRRVRMGLRSLWRFALKRVEIVVFQNGADRDFFLDLGAVTPARTCVIPGSGVDVQRLVPPSSVTTRGGPFTFLLACRLLREKGVQEYAQAATVLHRSGLDVRCLLAGELEPGVGNGITQAELGTWDDVEHLGFVNDMPSLLASIDCFVLPSYREGISRVLLEAGAMGIPSITSDVPGCRDVIEHARSGLLVRVRDANDLAAKMRVMVDASEAERRAMGDYARQRAVETFSVDRINEQYLQIIGARPSVPSTDSNSCLSREAGDGRDSRGHACEKDTG